MQRKRKRHLQMCSQQIGAGIKWGRGGERKKLQDEMK